jgi:hypothetical protein
MLIGLDQVYHVHLLTIEGHEVSKMFLSCKEVWVTDVDYLQIAECFTSNWWFGSQNARHLVPEDRY